MGRFLDALKAGVDSVKDEANPHGYSIAGRPVRCPHCGNQEFFDRQAMLNSRIRTVFNIDWFDPTATILVCSECGRIEWFAQDPDRSR
jgi:predicted nucleic-acid-binding Zn-ribbon protein